MKINWCVNEPEFVEAGSLELGDVFMVKSDFLTPGAERDCIRMRVANQTNQSGIVYVTLRGRSAGKIDSVALSCWVKKLSAELTVR